MAEMLVLEAEELLKIKNMGFKSMSEVCEYKGKFLTPINIKEIDSIELYELYVNNINFFRSNTSFMFLQYIAEINKLPELKGLLFNYKHGV